MKDIFKQKLDDLYYWYITRKIVKGEIFTYDELAHIASNYSISCMRGYDRSFNDWFSGLVPEWRNYIWNR